jgi:hypothetical protein
MAYRNTPYHVNLTGGFSGTFTPGGAVFYVADSNFTSVDGKGASDANDGNSPQTPFLTIQKGLNACVDGRGDVVALLPGSWTITAALTMTKADVTLCAAHGSVPFRKGGPVIVCATNSVKMLTIDAANVTVDGVTFDHNTTTAANSLIDIGASTAGTGSVIRNCIIDMEGSGTTTDGIAVTLGSFVVIENNLITDYDQDAITVANTQLGVIIRNNVILDAVAGATGRYGIYTIGDNNVIYGNTVENGGTAAVHIIGLQAVVVNNRLWAKGANTWCLGNGDAATTGSMGNHMGCITDAGNHVSYTTDNLSPSSSADLGVVTATNPTPVTFVDPVIG